MSPEPPGGQNNHACYDQYGESDDARGGVAGAGALVCGMRVDGRACVYLLTSMSHTVTVGCAGSAQSNEMGMGTPEAIPTTHATASSNGKPNRREHERRARRVRVRRCAAAMIGGSFRWHHRRQHRVYVARHSAFAFVCHSERITA